MRTVITLGLSAGLLIACGGEGGGNPDMPGPDMPGPDMPGPDLTSDGPGSDMGPTEIVDCDRNDLIIVAVHLGGSPTAELHNPTSSAITLNNSNYTWCRGPSEAYVRVTTTPVTIPAGGTMTFNLPATYGESDGMLALYRTTTAFTSRDLMLDWLCWGTGLLVGTGSNRRLTVAQSTGSDGTVMWNGSTCVDVGAATDIYRVPGTAGNEPAHYTTVEPMPGIDCM